MNHQLHKWWHFHESTDNWWCNPNCLAHQSTTKSCALKHTILLCFVVLNSLSPILWDILWQLDLQLPFKGSTLHWMGVSPWWLSGELPYCYPVISADFSSPFECQRPVNYFSWCPIMKWIDVTWIWLSVPVCYYKMVPNGCHFPDIFICVFLKHFFCIEVCISLKCFVLYLGVCISLNFFPKGPPN